MLSLPHVHLVLGAAVGFGVGVMATMVYTRTRETDCAGAKSEKADTRTHAHARDPAIEPALLSPERRAIKPFLPGTTVVRVKHMFCQSIPAIEVGFSNDDLQYACRLAFFFFFVFFLFAFPPLFCACFVVSCFVPADTVCSQFTYPIASLVSPPSSTAMHLTRGSSHARSLPL